MYSRNILLKDFQGFVPLTGNSLVEIRPEIVSYYVSEFCVEGVESFENGSTLVDHCSADKKYYLPQKYSLASSLGAEKEYTISPLQISEFKFFSINGKSSTLSFEKIDLHTFPLNIELEGDDFTSQTPEFTVYLSDYTEVLVNGTLQTSGKGSLDF